MKKAIVFILILNMFFVFSACGSDIPGDMSSASGDASGDASTVLSPDNVSVPDTSGNAMYSNGIRSISLKTDSKYFVTQYNGGYFLGDYYYYDPTEIVRFKEGDTLTIETDDGYNDYKYGYYELNTQNLCFNTGWGFFNGNDVINTNLFSQQRGSAYSPFEESWNEPGIYNVYLEYNGSYTPIEIEIIENNVESISFEPRYDVRNYVQFDNDGNAVPKNYFDDDMFQPGARYNDELVKWVRQIGRDNWNWTIELRRSGNKLHVYYKDGTEKTFIYQRNPETKENGFFDEEFKEKARVEARVDVSEWKLGQENTATVEAFGHTCEIPVAFIESQSKYYYDVTGINYIPAGEIVIKVDEEGKIIRGQRPYFNLGDVFEMIHDDGSKESFTYQYTDIGVNNKEFLDENGIIAPSPFIYIDEESLKPGEYNEATFTFRDYEITIPIKVIEKQL